jgi:hypothetical protein
MQGSELSKSIYRGASICPKRDGKKAKKVGRREIQPESGEFFRSGGGVYRVLAVCDTPSAAANTKYDEFHTAVGKVPRGRAVITML